MTSIEVPTHRADLPGIDCSGDADCPWRTDRTHADLGMDHTDDPADDLEGRP